MFICLPKIQKHCHKEVLSFKAGKPHLFLFLQLLFTSLTCLITYQIFQIRTKLVAPGGEALGGVIGAFRHVIQTEGFFSLYKGLLPSIMSIAPSAAVFYGVYDILKSAYLHSAEGRKRIQNMKRQGQELNALDQLELGPIRTLLHGAISGACAEAATYPFEVVRRQLQLQGRYNKGGVLTTSIKIVEHGGVPALYAGLVPSLLQVLAYGVCRSTLQHFLISLDIMICISAKVTPAIETKGKGFCFLNQFRPSVASMAHCLVSKNI